MLHPTRPIRKLSYLETGLSGNFFPVQVEEDSEGKKKDCQLPWRTSKIINMLNLCKEIDQVAVLFIDLFWYM